MSPKPLQAVCVCWLLCAAVLFAVRSARAVPEFPPEIIRELQLSYEPPCSVCHAKNNTGVGTVTTPFGYSARAHGLSADDRQSVRSALERMASDHTDSDGDGVSDVEELKVGSDPNSKTSVSIIDAAEPGYGCAVADGRGSGSGVFALLVLAFGLSLRLRRKRAAR